MVIYQNLETNIDMEEKSRFKEHYNQLPLKPSDYNIELKLTKGNRSHKLTVGIKSTDLNKSIEYLKKIRFAEYDTIEVLTVNGRYYTEK
jgi:hypothetical protein